MHLCAQKSRAYPAQYTQDAMKRSYRIDNGDYAGNQTQAPLFSSMHNEISSSQGSRGRPVQLAGVSFPMAATVSTRWTLRMTRVAGVLTWTWSSSTSTPSTGSSALLSSASSAISFSHLSKAQQIFYFLYFLFLFI